MGSDPGAGGGNEPAAASVIDAHHVGPRDEPTRYRLAEGMTPTSGVAGGQGLVWRAIRTGDGAAVALKLLTTLAPDDWAAYRRRTRELETVAHPHLARQFETFAGCALHTGTDPAPEDFDLLWSVAEWIEGTDFTSGAFDVPLATALGWVADIGRAAATLHAAGIVHRDIKPSNVRIGPRGAVLIDPGIARPLDDGTMTRFIGSGGWIPPETLTDDLPVGRAADAWQVAGLAWWAITGSSPGLRRLDRRIEELERRLADHGVGVAVRRRLAAHVAAMLVSDPKDRPVDLVRWGDELVARAAGLHRARTVRDSVARARRLPAVLRRVAPAAATGLVTAVLTVFATVAWRGIGPASPDGVAATTILAPSTNAVRPPNVGAFPGAAPGGCEVVGVPPSAATGVRLFLIIVPIELMPGPRYCLPSVARVPAPTTLIARCKAVGEGVMPLTVDQSRDANSRYRGWIYAEFVGYGTGWVPEARTDLKKEDRVFIPDCF